MDLNDDRTSSAPVIVIGGGPAGLATAAELAHHGVRSVVVEPRTEVSHARPRAKTTSPRTMEHFRRWGIAGEVRRRAPLSPEWNRRVVFCDTVAGPVITEFHDVFGLSAGPHELFAESGQQVPQPIVEEILREHVVATGLVELRLGDRATGVTETDDMVTVAITRADGGDSTLTAPYVVGADGCWSGTRDAIGAVLEGSSAPTSNLNVVFRSRRLRPTMGDAVQYWVLGSDVPGVLGPLDHDGLWWAGLAGAGDWCDAQGAVDLVAGLAGCTSAELDIEVLSTDPWTPRMLLADRFASSRVFLVGESAHLNPPFGGHGFNTCVGDAVNIGWKLAAVLGRWGGPDLLRSYEVERRHVAAETIASAAANLRASGPEIARSADQLQASKNEEFHSLGLVLGYTYAGSPVVAPTEDRGAEVGAVDAGPIDAEVYVPTTAPGARLPHVWIAEGRALYDDLGRGFSLLHPRTAPAAEIDRLVRDAERQGVPLTVLRTPTGAAWCDDQYLLVRPDQHVAWRGERLADLELAAFTGWAEGKVPAGA